MSRKNNLIYLPKSTNIASDRQQPRARILVHSVRAGNVVPTLASPTERRDARRRRPADEMFGNFVQLKSTCAIFFEISSNSPT